MSYDPVLKATDKLSQHITSVGAFLKTANENFMKLWAADITEKGTITDFSLIKVIGTGAFGIVFLVSKILNILTIFNRLFTLLHHARLNKQKKIVFVH